MRRIMLLGLGLAVAGVGATSAQEADRKEKIVITGSDRMVSILEDVAARFMERHPNVEIEVRGGGSIVAMRQLAAGESTVASVARPITSNEISRMRRASGIELVGIPIAVDAVVFLVNGSNPLAAISYEEIEAVFTERVRDWAHFYQDKQPVTLKVPSLRSGSYQVLYDRVLHGGTLGRNQTEYESRRELVNAVINDPRAVAFTGLGYTGSTKILPVGTERNAPAVAPTKENVRNRTYPLAHYIYLYFPRPPSGASRQFVRFVTGPEGQKIVAQSDAGPLPLPHFGAPVGE